MNFTNSELESFRSQSDPYADEVIKKIMENGSGRSINELFNKLIRNQDYDKVDLPPEISEYFKTTGGLPDWADQKKIAQGQDVFAQYGPQICLLLLCKSLPEAYSCKKGALVMYRTGRMTEGDDGSLKRFTRRLMETSQFVLNICVPGGYDKDGAGLITAQKVRLIHAAIRYFVQEAGWDAEENGLPINQEDLAGTLQSFSSLILEGLEQMGFKLTNEQIDGYFHCWRIAGHIVGVDPKLNPETYKEGLKLGYSILDHQRGPSEQGEVLTKAVVDFMERIIPGNLFDGVPSMLIRNYVGDNTADMLGVKKDDSAISKIAPRLLTILFKVEEALENHSKIFKEIGEKASLLLLQGMLNYFDDYKGVHFYIPPGLQKNWKLNVTWEHYAALSPPIAGYRLAVEKKRSSI